MDLEQHRIACVMNLTSKMMEYVQHAHHLVKIVPVYQFALVASKDLEIKHQPANVMMLSSMTMEHA